MPELFKTKADRDRATGKAQAVGGGALALGVPAVSRIERKSMDWRLKRKNEQIRRATADIPKRAPRGGTSQAQGASRFSTKAAGPVKNKKVSDGIKYQPKSQAQRESLRMSRKAAYSRVRTLEGQAAKIRKPKIYPHQSRLWVGAVAAGVPISYYGAKRAANADKVTKKMSDTDVKAAYAGGVGAGLGYQGGVMATKPLDWKNEKKIKNDPVHRAKMAEHEAKYRPKGMTAGDPRFREFFRNYPKSLPGGRMKRTLAVTHTGKTGGAATLGLIGAGAAGAVAANRRKDPVKKNMSTSAFGVDHGNEVSKKYHGWDPKDPKTGQTASGGRRALAYIGGPIHGGIAGRKGKKLRAAGNEYGGAVAGNVAGLALGAATRNRGVGSVAGLTGAVAGSQAGLARNQHKGYLKKES